VGGGNLEDIFNAAAASWERAFADVSEPWDVNITYGWADKATSLAACDLISQGGSPWRITNAHIEFNNSGFYEFFADPTPTDNSEYTTFTSVNQDLGGGVINVGRTFSNPTYDAIGNYDLLEVATHEIGHALGFHNDNMEFMDQIPGTQLTITPPLPYAGTEIPVRFGHIETQSALMFTTNNPGERRLISAEDILAIAQLSSFSNPNLNPESIGAPEPGSAALLIVPLTAWVAWMVVRNRAATPAA
jgi:hypothetical protein